MRFACGMGFLAVTSNGVNAIFVTWPEATTLN